MTPSDEELMMMVKQGNNSSAFDSLVKRHKVPLLNFVYRFIGDQNLAQDLSQDVFLRLWMSAETYLPVARFTTFLYTIAKNVCLNALAKSKNRKQTQSLNDTVSPSDEVNRELQDSISDPHSSPEDELIGMETQQRIANAIGKLSDEHRLVFVLTECDGLSYQDVAIIVQCPVGTVASRKNAAVKQLRRYLEPFITQ